MNEGVLTGKWLGRTVDKFKTYLNLPRYFQNSKKKNRPFKYFYFLIFLAIIYMFK